MINYFTQARPEFGNISWTMLVVWVLALGLGVYLLRSYRDSNPIRSRFVRQFGVITAILSALGIVLLVPKYLAVPTLEWRLWSYIIAFATLGYWAYAAYVYTSKLPAQIAAFRPTRSVRGSAARGARTYSTNQGNDTPKAVRQPRPIATTTRREARRDKKRKTR